MIQDSGIAIGEFRPKFQIALDRFGIESRQHSGLEVGHLAGIVSDVIAVGVANCFATGALVHDVAYCPMNLFHRMRSPKNEEQYSRTMPVFLTGEIFKDVIANSLLLCAVT